MTPIGPTDMTIFAKPTASTAPSDSCRARVDPGYFGIVGLVALIFGWLLLMPFVSAIRATTMNRFHLRTASFWQWAVQQPIPAMYNFANHVEVTRTDPLTGKTDVVLQRPVNHFPVQAMTFATGRYQCLNEGLPCQIRATSTYRGDALETVFDVVAGDHRSFVMTRVTDQSSGKVE